MQLVAGQIRYSKNFIFYIQPKRFVKKREGSISNFYFLTVKVKLQSKRNIFIIFGEKELNKFKINVSRPKVSLVVSSGVDWFDVQTKIDFGGSPVSLEALLTTLKQKKNYIQLNDGSVGIPPKPNSLRK